MGREALCTCRYPGGVVNVKAILESTEIIFRGELKRRIAISTVTHVVTDGAELRFESRGEAFALIIRVHAKHVFTLDRYVEKGEMSEVHASYLTEAIREEANIGVAGSVNSGKTTLLNALLHRKSQLHASARGVIVQDRRELRYDDFEDVLPLMARIDQAHHESNGAVMRYTYEFSDALEDALRSNGDFLVWGEVRDGYSALGLTMALNTGTKGLMMTTHANSCMDTLFRLEDLLRLNGKTPVRRMIARVVDVLVFMERDRETGRRRVTEVSRVLGVDETNDTYSLEEIPG